MHARITTTRIIFTRAHSNNRKKKQRATPPLSPSPVAQRYNSPKNITREQEGEAVEGGIVLFTRSSVKSGADNVGPKHHQVTLPSAVKTP